MTATGQGGDAAQQAQQQGQNGNGNGTGEGEAQQAAPDFAALSQQLETLAGGQEDLRQFLASNPWQAQEQQETGQEQQQAPEVDLSFLDVNDPAYDPEQMSQKLTDAVGQYVQNAIQQGTAPVMEQMQDMQREQAARDLVGEFPDLEQQEVAQQVVGAAHEYAQALGMPQLGNDPGFWRLVYLSGRAIDAAQQEGAEAPGAAHLEGSGGANPGASQVDPADAIMNAGGKKGSGVLPF